MDSPLRSGAGTTSVSILHRETDAPLKYIVIASFLVIPALAAWIVSRFSGGRWLPPLLAAAAVGALGVGFLTRAASAMASAIDDDEAMLRGDAVGAGLGLVAGLLVLGAIHAVRRARASSDRAD